MGCVGLLRGLPFSSTPSALAFANPGVSAAQGWPPVHALFHVDAPTLPTPFKFKKLEPCSRRRRRPSRAGAFEPHSSTSAAGSSEIAREDESAWLADLSPTAADSSDVASSSAGPFVQHSPNVITTRERSASLQQDGCRTHERDRAELGSMYAARPRPLLEGRTLRSMTESDIEGVVLLALTEFYDGPTGWQNAVEQGRELWEKASRRASSQGGFVQTDVEELTDWLEMFWLRAVIGLGFGMRVNIGHDGQDHRVYCVFDAEDKHNSGGDGALVAVAEVSLQIPNGKTAPRFPLPRWIKEVWAWPRPVAPYISNLLVDPSVRRQGVATNLVRRCEQQARDWGYTQVFLHVERRNWPAVRMYESLGYEVVGMLEVSYINPLLRYMKKIL